MTIKGCIFDLDGVLVDTARFHFLAWKNLADRLGFDFTESDNERLKGVSRMASLEILLEIGKLAPTDIEKQEYAAEKNALYLQFIEKMKPEDILPGVREFLNELKKAGIRVGLGSVSKNARTILSKTSLTDFFDAIVDGNIISRAKPDPEVFLTGAKMLNLPPARCIVFEDAVAGVEAAHRAGMKCVGVGSRDILGEADLIIPGFENLTMKDLIFD
jgi:beta-phosphoglucomutase